MHVKSVPEMAAIGHMLNVYKIMMQTLENEDQLVLLAKGQNERPIELIFLGVRDLRLNILDCRRVRIIGFDIIEISSSQLEGIRFKVTDYEDGMVHFYCSSFRLEDQSNAGMSQQPTK